MAEVLSRHQQPFCVLYCAKNLTRYVSILASVLAGKVFVPVCPSSPPSYCARVFEQVGDAIYLFDSGEPERERQLLEHIHPDSPVIHAYAGRAMHTADVMEPFDCAEHAGAYLMFTSGSTGVPKAVLVTRHNLYTYLEGAIELFHPTPADRFAQVNNYTFDLSMHDIFVAWATGGSVYALPDTAPFRMPALLREHRLTFWLSVPTTGLSLANLALLRPDSLPDLRCSLFCGEPLPSRLAAAWHVAAPNSRIFNIYGPTECTIAVTAFEWLPDMLLPEVVPIGTPYPGQQVCVVDQHLREVPFGQVGELCLGGDQLVPGYYANAEQTARRFVRLAGRDGMWYRTGDWAIEDSGWGLQFKGRCDDQMQIRGYRVERLEVEGLMRRALGTDSVAVVGWPIAEGNLVQGLVAFVDGVTLSIHQIRSVLTQELPEHMWPSQIHMQPLPQTRSRKIDYEALKRQLTEDLAATRRGACA
jgi:amino acid adenylation domain-containing protein